MIKKIFVALTLSSLAISGSSVNAQTISFSEDFETGMDGWTVVVEDTSTVNNAVIEFAPGWITLADPNNTTDTVCGATSYFSVPGKARRWLISPAITLGAYGNIIRWSARSHDPSYPDNYQVLISETTTDIAAFMDTIVSIGGEYEDWHDYEVNIADSGGYVSQVVHIAFVLNSYDQFKLYLDDITMTVDDPVGIAENEMDWVMIYPNPATDILRLKTDKEIDKVEVYNAAGQLVKSTPYTTSGLNISELQSGIYLVEITTKNATARKRLVIR